MDMSRKEYLAPCTMLERYPRHMSYYGQYITIAYSDMIARMIGHDRLLASRDANLNDIPLGHWGMPISANIANAMRANGDCPTKAGAVCLEKQAALQWLARQGVKVWPILYKRRYIELAGAALGPDMMTALENFKSINADCHGFCIMNPAHLTEWESVTQ